MFEIRMKSNAFFCSIMLFFQSISRRSTYLYSVVDDCLCFLQDTMQMICSTKTFCIDLIYIFSPGWTSGEPSTLGNHFHPPMGPPIPRRMGKKVLIFFPRQFSKLNLLG